MNKVIPLTLGGYNEVWLECGCWGISSNSTMAYIPLGDVLQGATFVQMSLTTYDQIKKGDVFFPFDEDGCYPFDDPDLYMMYMAPAMHRYLTGKDDYPVGIDTNTYEKVWKVIEGRFA